MQTLKITEAIANDNVELVEQILRSNPSLLYNRYSATHTIFNLAMEEGSYNVIDFLLQRYNFSYQDLNKMSSALFSENTDIQSFLFFSKVKVDTEIIHKLIKRGISISQQDMIAIKKLYQDEASDILHDCMTIDDVLNRFYDENKINLEKVFLSYGAGRAFLYSNQDFILKHNSLECMIHKYFESFGDRMKVLKKECPIYTLAISNIDRSALFYYPTLKEELLKITNDIDSHLTIEKKDIDINAKSNHSDLFTRNNRNNSFNNSYGLY